MTEPTARDVPFLDVQTVTLESGQRATLDYILSNTRSQFHLVMAAISKYPDMMYSIEMDGSDEYEAAIPPTDVDNGQATYLPPQVFNESMTVQVSNLSDVQRTCHVQIKGWERPPTVDEGGF